MVTDTPPDALSESDARERIGPHRHQFLSNLTVGDGDHATLGYLRNHATRVKRFDAPTEAVADYYIGTLEHWGLVSGPPIADAPGDDAVYELTELGETLAERSSRKAEADYEYVSPTSGVWTPHVDLPVEVRQLGLEVSLLRIARETDTEIHL